MNFSYAVSIKGNALRIKERSANNAKFLMDFNQIGINFAGDVKNA